MVDSWFQCYSFTDFSDLADSGYNNLYFTSLWVNSYLIDLRGSFVMME